MKWHYQKSPLFCFILISWGCLISPTFLLVQWANLIGPWPKKVETMEPPQNRRFYGKMECLSLWPTYIGKKGRTLGKTNGIKATCYWEHPWGTHWEPRQDIGNPFGKFFRKTSSCQKFPHFVRKMDNNENIFKETTGVWLWAKQMGLKRGAIGSTLGEHIGNLGKILGTWWEPIGNFFRKPQPVENSYILRGKWTTMRNIFKEITGVILTKDIGMNIKTLTKHKGMPFSSQTCFWG